MKPKTNGPDNGLLTINGLSEATGFDRRTIKRKLHGITPAKTARGFHYYRMAEVLPVLESELECGESNALIDEERREKIKNWKIRNDKMTGRLVEKAEVERELASMIYNLTRRFDAADSELAARVIGKTAGQARDMIRENRRRIFDEVCRLPWEEPPSE